MNITAYLVYFACTRAYFWYAIFFLYFQSKFSTADVLLLEAIYYASVVIVEVPSGYLSDRFGRVTALRASALSLTAAYAIFTVADSFLLFAAAQFLFATGFAFASGSDTSFLYASLAEQNREDEFPTYESKAASIGSFTAAFSAIAGGVLGTFALHYGHFASAIAAGTALMIAFFVMREPEHDERPETMEFFGNVRASLTLLKRKDLAWLFATVVVTLILVHIPYEYYQPYIKSLGEFELVKLRPTVATGIHAAVALFIAGFFARFGAKAVEKFGLVTSTLAALSIFAILIFLMANTAAWWVAAVLLFRSAPNAFLRPILNAAVVPRIPDEVRATYLSLQSLAGRLMFALTLTLFSWVATQNPDGGLSPMLWVGFGIAVVAILLLALTSKFVRLEQA